MISTIMRFHVCQGRYRCPQQPEGAVKLAPRRSYGPAAALKLGANPQGGQISPPDRTPTRVSGRGTQPTSPRYAALRGHGGAAKPAVHSHQASCPSRAAGSDSRRHARFLILLPPPPLS